MKEEVNQELQEFRRLFQVKYEYDQPADLHDMVAWCLEEIDRMNRQVQEVRAQVSLGHQSVVEEMLSEVTWLHSTYKVNCYNKGTSTDKEDAGKVDEERKKLKLTLGTLPSVPTKCILQNVNRSAGMSLLHTAASIGHIGITEMLLNRGVNVNGCNDVGLTALHVAVDSHHVPIVQLLLQRGADANSESEAGIPIQLSQSSEMVQLLLNAGTDIKAKFSHTNPAKIVPLKCIFYTALCAKHGAPLLEAIIRDYPDSAKYSS